MKQRSPNGADFIQRSPTYEWDCSVVVIREGQHIFNYFSNQRFIDKYNPNKINIAAVKPPTRPRKSPQIT